MFVVHGQSGAISAIIGTSSLRKAVTHMNRMTQAGLQASITDEKGRPFDATSLVTGLPARRGALH